VVADDAFTAPYRVSGTAVSSITNIIQRSLPAATVVNFAVDAAIGPRTWDIAASPWDAAIECAAAIGADVFTDPEGVFTIAPLPDLASATPVWTIGAGEGGVYISANRGMSSGGVFNAVLARGENTETGVAPVSALVTDNDPTSPTYWSGPYGRRPYFHTSSTLVSSDQCLSAGTLLLSALRAPNATADITLLPNPALAPGDVVRVIYPDGSKELHQVQAYSVSLTSSGAFTLQTVSAKEGT
jgi:hypothetical protein